MSKEQQELTGQEPRLGGAGAAKPPVSINLPGLGGSVGIMHLAEHLNDPDPRVRERVLLELGRLGDDRALNGLIDMMQNETDAHGRDRAVRALGLLGDPRAAHPLMEHTQSVSQRVSKQVGALALRRICEAHPETLDSVVSHLLACLPDDDQRTGTALILGGLGDAQAVKPLVGLLVGSSFYIWDCVIPALGMLGKEHADIAPYILDELWKYSRRFDFNTELIKALHMIGLQHEDLAGQIVQILKGILSNPGQYIAGIYVVPCAAAAVRALGEIGSRHASTTTAVIGLLVSALKHTSPYVLESVALALGGIDDDRAAEALWQAFRTCKDNLRPCFAKAMGQQGMIEPLIEALSGDARLSSAAAEGLGTAGDLRAVEPLIGVLASKDFKTRREAAKALGLLRSPRAVHPLIGVLTDGRQDVRRAAAEALGKIEKAHRGTAEPAVPALIPLLDDKIRSVQEAAAKTLGYFQTAEAHEAVWHWRFPDVQRGV